MATAIHSYGQTASLSTNEFERLGHQGKFHKVVQLNAGQSLVFTGSNFGAGGILTSNTANGYYTLSGGGTGSLSALSAGYIHELGPIFVSVASGGPVFVYIRNHYVR